MKRWIAGLLCDALYWLSDIVFHMGNERVISHRFEIATARAAHRAVSCLEGVTER